MKKITSSIIAALAVSTFVVAGGDIAPVEPEVTLPEVVEESTGSFYLGLAYSYVNADTDFTSIEYFASSADVPIIGSMDTDFDAFMLQAGYAFNKYFAIEGRYWSAIGDGDSSISATQNGNPVTNLTVDDSDFSAWGIYVKPMYPVTESLSVYGLLGYGNTSVEDSFGDIMDESGFQWGAGASYAMTDSLSLFVDYVCLASDEDTFRTYDANDIVTVEDTMNTDVYTVNFGLTYSF